MYFPHNSTQFYVNWRTKLPIIVHCILYSKLVSSYSLFRWFLPLNLKCLIRDRSHYFSPEGGKGRGRRRKIRGFQLYLNKINSTPSSSSEDLYYSNDPPPMGSSFFLVPLLYSINDWSPLRFPHDKKWPNLLTFQACTQCFKRCCMAQPCFNGGTCRENCHVTGRRFLCHCPARFIGNVCEKGMLLM